MADVGTGGWEQTNTYSPCPTGRHCAACTYLTFRPHPRPRCLLTAIFRGRHLPESLTTLGLRQGAHCRPWANALHKMRGTCTMLQLFFSASLKISPCNSHHNRGRHRQEDYQKYFRIRSFKICYFKSLLNISTTTQHLISLALSPQPPSWDFIMISMWVSKTTVESSQSVLFCFCTWRDHAC